MAGSEHFGISADIGARFSKEGGKDRHLQQKHQARNQPHTEGIYHSLGNDRTQGLGERNTIVLGEDTATGHLPYPGNDQIGGIGDEDGIHAMGRLGIFAQGFQCQLPSPSTKQVGKHTEHQRKSHPTVIHSISQHFSHPLEIEVTIDPKENKSPQQKRKNDLQYLLEYLFSFSSFQNRRFFKLHCLYLHDAKILS